MRFFQACIIASSTFMVCPAIAQVTIADAGPDQYLCDDNAFLQGNAVASGETGSWSIVSGVGNLNDLSDPASQITGQAGSVIVLRWTISDGTNTTSDDVAIWLYDGDAPWANAGPDQVVFIPQTSAQLQGSPYMYPMTCVWTVVQGSGIITDPTDPFAAYSGAGVGQNILVWTCDNGPCGVSSDELVITAEEAMALGGSPALPGIVAGSDPRMERLYISAPEGIDRVLLADQMGRCVLDRSMDVRSASFDVGHLASGAYSLRVSADGVPVTERIAIFR